MGDTGDEDDDAGNKDKNRRKPFPLLKNNVCRTLWKNALVCTTLAQFNELSLTRRDQRTKSF
ncbi:hypothetical protein E1301_Tti013149 [Triplophysa tibetana]|uniref:Uncharacterized protein n=1 Tax=Triplophysa tibetana TaxID=1572043 RepID=A0A5A9PC00_9TELE|nr:hypothetical protein E1301_Tti013149 [Triplophysa tibetana]